MFPPILIAAGLATSVTTVASDSSRDACAEDANVARVELDESSMLQQVIANVHVQTSAEDSSEQVLAASDVLAGTWSLVHAVKEKSNGVDNITRAANDYVGIVEQEVIPNIEAALVEIDSLLDTQREFVKQCDVRLHAGDSTRAQFHHTFLEKRSLHKACSFAESSLAKQVATCLETAADHEDCSKLESFHAAKVTECADLKAAVDEAACAQASRAHAACEAYGDCRLNSMAVYESAAKSATKRARGHRVQLAEAKQAQCIAHGLVSFVNDAKGLTKHLDGCKASDPDSDEETLLVRTGAEEMPPPMICQDAAIQACSDDFIQIDLGPSLTWSVPCTSCPAMAQITTDAAIPSSWLSRLDTFALSAKNIAQAYLDPRQRSAMTVSFIGVSTKTTVVSKGQSASTAQYLVILIAVPLVALGIALGVAVACAPGRQNHYANDSNMSPKMSSSRRGSLGQRGVKEAPSPRLADPRLSTRHSFSSSHDRPSMVGGQMHSHPYSQDQSPVPPRHSLPPSVGASFSESHHSGAGLCPELVVPEGSECILGVPTLSGAPRGEVLLKNITDKTGESLLYVGLTAAPAGGEYVLLAKKDQQELAFCELGNAVRSEGWSGKVFRWDGELYARIREENNSETGRRSSGIPGINRTFVVLSAAGSPWELRVTGNFRERKLCIEDASRQVVAMVSPGTELAFSQPAGEFYKLRLGPRADSCTVIVALLAIERLMCP